jgi:glutamate-1-semialdehyde 2,1-aminomutase
MFGFFFHPGAVRNFEDAKKSHSDRFKRFFHSLLDQGVYLAPSPFEAGFVSLAHTRRDIRTTLQAAEIAFERASRVR